MMVAISISALLLYVGQIWSLQSKVNVRETRTMLVPEQEFSKFLSDPDNLRKWIRGLSEVNIASAHDSRIAFVGQLLSKGKKTQFVGTIEMAPNMTSIEIEDDSSLVRRIVRFEGNKSSTEVELELVSYKTSAWGNLMHLLSSSTVQIGIEHELRYLDLSLSAEIQKQTEASKKTMLPTDS
jgi:hypothetical protein